MLQRQSPPDVMSFLAGDGEMARMIRAYDWKNHPFGPTESWPQSLRSALGICLQSAFPTAIYWGSELRLLYNDAWSVIPGPRHPDALGQPASEVWSDIWHVIEPQFSHLIATGEGIFVEDQMLPMRRYGYEEETYWTYNFTPIRNEDGSIAGVFNSGNETTRNVMLQRQMSFLLEIAEVFRSADDFAAARRRAIRMLGEHIGAQRVGLREVAPEAEEDFPIDEIWMAPDMEAVDTNLAFENLGGAVTSRLMAGQIFRTEDLDRDAALADVRQMFANMGVAAAIAIPWRRNGKTVAILFVHCTEPRAWNDFDISTTEKVLEKIMLSAEREVAADRERVMMREIDHRARNALALAQSIVRLTSAEDICSFRTKVEDRVAALARAHAIMSSERWRPVELGTLLKEELAPFTEADFDRLTLTGPSVRLLPEQAQTIALLFHELVTNAVKYGALRESRGKLAVDWQTDHVGDLTVIWTETEISPAALESQPVGSGFGTTLIQRVIEHQLGGKIQREIDDDGLRYTFTIPLGLPEKAAMRPATDSRSDGSVGRGTALIVEDEPIVALDIESMIENLGYSVLDSVSSVADGLSALEERIPDFAILDANLRGESSVPLAEALSARDVPIIFATGYTEMRDLPERLSHTSILTKPISQSQLADAIKQACMDDS